MLSARAQSRVYRNENLDVVTGTETPQWEVAFLRSLRGVGAQRGRARAVAPHANSPREKPWESRISPATLPETCPPSSERTKASRL